jgi:uncharacterized protein YfiM (DUF2279 family)
MVILARFISRVLKLCEVKCTYIWAVRKNLFHIFLLCSFASSAQLPSLSIKDSAAGTRSAGRKWLVGGGTAIIYGTSFAALNNAWYRGYPRSSFHSFNDAGEWNQMDKLGHSWTAYNLSRAGTALWKWAGVTNKNSILLGTGTSLAYMLSIEYLDGRSAEWGWSWADVGADVFGALLFAGQEGIWKQQKIQFKFSSHRDQYNASLNVRANDLFGKSLPERLLKDYNAQTYWLSLHVSSLIETAPRWLNISFGYGAQNMYGGYENIAYDQNGDIIFERKDLKRYRQWYLSPDIDLTRIKTRSSLLRTLFFVLNAIKIPAPAIEFSNGKFKAHPLMF